MHSALRNAAGRFRLLLARNHKSNHLFACIHKADRTVQMQK